MYKPAKPGGAHLLPLFRNRALGVSVHMGYKWVTGCFVAESPLNQVALSPVLQLKLQTLSAQTKSGYSRRLNVLLLGRAASVSLDLKLLILLMLRLLARMSTFIYLFSIKDTLVQWSDLSVCLYCSFFFLNVFDKNKFWFLKRDLKFN